MITTESYLSKYGISIEQAYTFIMSNLNNLQLVFDTCKEYGVNNDMIADIVGSGYTGSDVENYFNDNGFNGAELGYNPAFSTELLKGNNKSQSMEEKQSVDSTNTNDGTVPIVQQSNILSEGEVSSLLFMIEEEKMARDIYDELFEQTGLIQFDKISDSEQQHYNTLLTTAAKLGIDTDSLSTQAGVFTNSAVQSLYDQLIAQGSISTESAIDVGITIEQTDITDLQTVIDTTEITLLGQVYNNLLDASVNHLNAFENIA